jgi:hypothetical protein
MEIIHILEFGGGIGRNIPFCHFETIESPDDLRKFDGVIDCVFIVNVLHHIPHDEHKV